MVQKRRSDPCPITRGPQPTRGFWSLHFICANNTWRKIYCFLGGDKFRRLYLQFTSWAELLWWEFLMLASIRKEIPDLLPIVSMILLPTLADRPVAVGFLWYWSETSKYIYTIVYNKYRYCCSIRHIITPQVMVHKNRVNFRYVSNISILVSAHYYHSWRYKYSCIKCLRYILDIHLLCKLKLK